MKTQFGQELLEKLTSKFIIQLSNYLHDKHINWISVQNVITDSIDKLNQITTIKFRDYNNILFELKVTHAKDMSCSNWDLQKNKTLNNKTNGTK